MPSSSNQKMKLLYLMKIFLEQTDEQHSLSMPEIIAALGTYNIKAERKSIYSDIELLRSFGLDIEHEITKTHRYYINSRRFQLPELKLLVDAVQSSRFITAKKSADLIKRLYTLTSVHQGAQLNRSVFVTNRPKSMNERIFYSVDAIHAAINSGHKICFKYFDYSPDKREIFRKNGDVYCQTPIALCWNDDKYYLICYSKKYDDYVHYRVDRMSRVEISDEAADKTDKKRFNIAEHTKRVFGMYGGELFNARLRFDNSLVNAVLDAFGTDIVMHAHGDFFEINVEVSSSPVFLSWIFQFGSRAEILSPFALRESMSALINESLQKYME